MLGGAVPGGARAEKLLDRPDTGHPQVLQNLGAGLGKECSGAGAGRGGPGMGREPPRCRSPGLPPCCCSQH